MKLKNKIKINIGLIILVTIPLLLLASYLRLPAYALLCPLVVTFYFSLRLNRNIKIHNNLFALTQACLGCILASSASNALFTQIFQAWWVFLIITFSIILFCMILAKIMHYFTKVPNVTTICALLPGGASVMSVASEELGADIQIVVIVQYLRVILIIVFLSMLATIYPISNMQNPTTIQTAVMTPQTYWLGFFYTCIVAIVSYFLCKVIKFPAARILIPIVICIICQLNGLFQVTFPFYAKLIVLGIVGMNIGSKFDFTTIHNVIRILPCILCCIILIILFGLLQAIFLVYNMDIDLFTAILATCPGGIDVAMIIGMDTGADMMVILAVQMMRLLATLFIGPILVKFAGK